MATKTSTLVNLRRRFAVEFASTLVALVLIAAVKVGLLTLVPW